MRKLKGYSKVAVTRIGSKKYHFAIYDDGVNYEVGNKVYVSGITGFIIIEKILTAKEYKELTIQNSKMYPELTAEVICKIDEAKYIERKQIREAKDKRLRELQKGMDAFIESQGTDRYRIYSHYFYFNDSFQKMYDEYKELMKEEDNE